MFRKTIITIAATAVLASSSFASSAFASDEGFEVPPVQTKQRSEGISGKQIAAGIALGVVAGLLGAEVKRDRGHQGKGFRKQRRAKTCEDVPVLGGKKGNRVVAFRQVCD